MACFKIRTVINHVAMNHVAMNHVAMNHVAMNHVESGSDHVDQ